MADQMTLMQEREEHVRQPTLSEIVTNATTHTQTPDEFLKLLVLVIASDMIQPSKIKTDGLGGSHNYFYSQIKTELERVFAHMAERRAMLGRLLFMIADNALQFKPQFQSPVLDEIIEDVRKQCEHDPQMFGKLVLLLGKYLIPGVKLRVAQLGDTHGYFKTKILPKLKGLKTPVARQELGCQLLLVIVGALKKQVADELRVVESDPQQWETIYGTPDPESVS